MVKFPILLPTFHDANDYMGNYVIVFGMYLILMLFSKSLFSVSAKEPK